jgi:phage terminase large subunit GpA-like protein
VIGAHAAPALRPPPRVVGSAWADERFILSPESHGQHARWKCSPLQRAWLDDFSDPDVEQITLMKPARIGGTKSMVVIPLGIEMDTDPGPTMVVEPTLDLAREFSRDELEPMVRDCPALRGKVKTRGGGKTSLLRKSYRGGFIVVRGANSAAGLSSKTIRRLFLDEVDRYPPSAGDEGDPVLLAIRRTQTFARRKIVAVSTPGVGPSRIEALYLSGDQRRYMVPCPHCGVFDELVWQRNAEWHANGHVMAWEEGQPHTAHFVCSSCSERIDEHHKAEMLAAGYWEARAPWQGRPDRQHRSYWCWAAYSEQANASWARLVAEYEEVKNYPDRLQTFWNTVLGLVWQVQGEAPEWEGLMRRRETYAAEVPAGVKLLTAGVDVQRDRLVWGVVGWGAGKENWGIERGEFVGDTSSPSSPVWGELDVLLASTWNGPGGTFSILRMAVDSGDQTQTVYAWARRHPDRVMAIKGVAKANALLSSPRRVTVTAGGRQIVDGCKLWIVGTHQAKEQLYGWLRLTAPPGGPYPAGYCHWPDTADFGEEFFKQLTAEQMITVRKRNGFLERQWVLLPGRQNHALDVAVYAMAAAAPAQIDRMLRARPGSEKQAPAPKPRQEAAPAPAERPPTKDRPTPVDPRPRGGWLGGGGRPRRGGGWLR